MALAKVNGKVFLCLLATFCARAVVTGRGVLAANCRDATSVFAWDILAHVCPTGGGSPT